MDKPATRQTSLISNNKSLIDQKGKCSVKRLNIVKKKKKKKKKKWCFVQYGVDEKKKLIGELNVLQFLYGIHGVHLLFCAISIQTENVTETHRRQS
jgi:hypothetical protein